MLLLAAWLSVTLENVRLAAGTERLAITDEATEIYNARYLKSALKRELRRAHRFGQELSLLLVDVDDPAPSGESAETARNPRLLREVAALLASQVRSFDVLGTAGRGQLHGRAPADELRRRGGSRRAHAQGGRGRHVRAPRRPAGPP